MEDVKRDKCVHKADGHMNKKTRVLTDCGSEGSG